ncbi:LIM homeobox transcription factor 1-beta isoform X3 [Sitodiplosis mosellana]|uniref:LIM homeobox transcription factor 1-beta isoform X3 n=1 Tax=Sitodiplosis mosellana TaxID=263140 RepID=UPI00244434E7|nr:LIM homeobox transcription factor 1-beta isoform X3 [Sitodiplosis mosellana]
MIEQKTLYPMFAMDVKPAISVDSVSPTIPEISSLTTTTLTSCSNSSNISTYNNGKTALAPEATLCGLCFQPIYDQYIMRVVDTYYHERCLQCCSCSKRLMHSCFSRNGKIYCRIDYERIYLKNNCLGCNKRINSEEFVMRTASNVFHLKCFTCVVCGSQLQKGEQYVVKQSQLFCRNDYEKEVEMLKGYNDEYFSEDVYTSKIDGRRGPKRPRTILNTQQRRAFKASFDVSPKPCRKVRENLARETGLSLRIVQVWFQNQRAKVKKIQKKRKQDGKLDTENDSQGENNAGNGNAAKSDSDSYSNVNLDADQTFPIKKEKENSEDGIKSFELCANSHHFPAENFNGTDDIQDNAVMGLAYSTFQRILGNTPQVLNPIDRLYSMQNYYFRCNNRQPNEPDDNDGM